MAGLQKLSRSALRGEGAEQSTRMDAVRTAVERLPTRQAYAEELTRLWREAQDRFVAIGEYLMYAKETLAHGEYEKMVSSDLPFGRAVAHTLRTVALAVREGRLTKLELPRSYTTAYFLATLQSDHLALARERGLLRHDVSRSTVDAFRRELRAPASRGEYNDLQLERIKLQAQLVVIQQRLAEIDGKIGLEGSTLIEGEAELVPLPSGEITFPGDIGGGMLRDIEKKGAPAPKKRSRSALKNTSSSLAKKRPVGR